MKDFWGLCRNLFFVFFSIGQTAENVKKKRKRKENEKEVTKQGQMKYNETKMKG